MNNSLDHSPLSAPEADRLPSRELGNENPALIKRGHKGTSIKKEEESKHGDFMNSQRGKYPGIPPCKNLPETFKFWLCHRDILLPKIIFIEEEKFSQNQAHNSQFRSAHPSGDSERNQTSVDEGEEDSEYTNSSESTSEINADSDEEHM